MSLETLMVVWFPHKQPATSAKQKVDNLKVACQKDIDRQIKLARIEFETKELNAEIRKLPANATDLCQPADSFVISKIKSYYKAAKSLCLIWFDRQDQACLKRNMAITEEHNRGV